MLFVPNLVQDARKVREIILMVSDVSGIAGFETGHQRKHTLSMTDKDRMEVVDECFRSMRRYRNLVSYYTNKNIAVSYLRAKK